jgi:2-polyprenyl-3-methyl-5-hydroxy-6-metoxy-1,4-benzoquinol methylase
VKEGALIPLYREMHAEGHFWGRAIRYHMDRIAQLAQSSGAKTLLDYGCGKGRQYTEKHIHERWGIMPTLYDPAVEEWSEKPRGRFDGVICTDVLEHIPEDELDDAITDLARYSRMWCFASISCVPAGKTFPDGRNVHVTIQRPAWWKRKMLPVFANRAQLHLSFQR